MSEVSIFQARSNEEKQVPQCQAGAGCQEHECKTGWHLVGETVLSRLYRQHRGRQGLTYICLPESGIFLVHAARWCHPHDWAHGFECQHSAQGGAGILTRPTREMQWTSHRLQLGSHCINRSRCGHSRLLSYARVRSSRSCVRMH